MNIRNFCIIAHIDHGKSTLADRILEYTNAVPKEQMKPQILDRIFLEKERGITIKTKTVRINYNFNNENYILNLIDTPGHVDFSYEVSRALMACEGTLLVVDASQGVEAQTLANVFLAKKYNLKIIPIINKIDLPVANIEETDKQIKNILQIYSKPILVSAKNGIGIDEVINSIITEIPSPAGNINSDLEAVVFDSFYDPYKGVIVFVRVFNGRIKVGQKIIFFSVNKEYEILETGYICLKLISSTELTCGEVGYIIAGIKNIGDIKIGDIIIEKDKPNPQKRISCPQIKPFVFAGIYCINPGDFNSLKNSLEKLHLTDASFTFSPTNSIALGPGFHCGFLGSLHLEIIKERLEREYNLGIIVTSPNVVYRIKQKNNSYVKEIDNPAKFPDSSEIDYIEEPYIKATIISPNEYSSSVIELCKSKRGKVLEIKQLDTNHILMDFEMPLSEIIVGFYDSLKSVSKGYASFDYKPGEYKKSELVKLEVCVNKEIIDAFSYIVHESKMHTVAQKLIEKLKATIPRHLFQIPLQIMAKNRIIARDDIYALRKDVLAKCYGGDVTRKRKLLEKQKEGKKRMKQFGRVEIPQETFFSLLKID